MIKHLTLQSALVFTVAACGSVSALPPGTGWETIFSDDFDGTTLNTNRWGYNYSWGRTLNHRGYMDESQVSVGSGKLTLGAINQRHPNAPAGITQDGNYYSLDYTTGAVHTSGLEGFKYGYVEARMKMSNTKGTWPAFWMLQSGWPPEIDIMEFPLTTDAQKSRIWANYHYSTATEYHKSYGTEMYGPDWTGGFHTVGMDWSASAMKFYIDGVLKYTVSDATAIAQSQSMYMILNNAVGGWPGNPPAGETNWPAPFEIDYVKVWQKAPTQRTSTWALSGNGSWDTAANWTGPVPTYGNQTIAFNGQTSAAINIDWKGTRVVGDMIFSGATAYALGNGDEALQFIKSSGNSLIQVNSGARSPVQTIRADLELSNNLRVSTAAGMLTILSGNITGAGNLSLETGPFTLSSSTSTDGDISILGGASVSLAGTLFDLPENSATGKLTIAGGSTLRTASGAFNGNLGVLDRAPAKLVLDNGTLLFTGSFNAQRGITISAGGATLLTSASQNVSLTERATGEAIASVAGGRLTLGGAGSGTLSAQLTGTGGLTKTGSGTWTVQNTNNYTGSTQVDSGTLVTSTFRSTGPVVINSGAMIITAKASPNTSAGTSVITALTINAGKLDITNNSLILNYSGVSPIDQVRSMLNSGITAGNGIITSLYANGMCIGYAEASATETSTFGGLNVDQTSLLLMATYPGDLDLNGAVNTYDFNIVAANFGTGQYWTSGDVNYDGTVDSTDFSQFLSAYGSALSAAPSLGANVPEPATTTLGFILALVACRRRL